MTNENLNRFESFLRKERSLAKKSGIFIASVSGAIALGAYVSEPTENTEAKNPISLHTTETEVATCTVRQNNKTNRYVARATLHEASVETTRGPAIIQLSSDRAIYADELTGEFAAEWKGKREIENSDPRGKYILKLVNKDHGRHASEQYIEGNSRAPIECVIIR